MRITDRIKLKQAEAVLIPLGQAGYIIKDAGTTIVIDPYLSDSVGKLAKDFKRAFPVPVNPAKLKADIFIVTHDHLDHLDPETVKKYQHKNTTTFVGPGLVKKKLITLGVPQKNIKKINAGESAFVRGVKITGIYSVPTGKDVPDTTGYLMEFKNKRTVYHTSDTAYKSKVGEGALGVEVILVCINGKWGNLNAEEAVKVTAKVKPLYAVPNHYDVMKLNSENPRIFEYFLKEKTKGIKTKILKVMEPFKWGGEKYVK